MQSDKSGYDDGTVRLAVAAAPSANTLAKNSLRTQNSQMKSGSSPLSRRQFLKSSSALTAAAALTPGIVQSTTELAASDSVAASSTKTKMIGIQVGAISFVDEGTNQVLDILQEKGAVNTIFLATFTYGRGIAGRQVPNASLPDHGKQELLLDAEGYRGDRAA